MKPIDIRAEAELDIIEAALWYENEREGFGADVLFGVIHLHRDPEVWKHRR
jgi:hypothetical protein